MAKMIMEGEGGHHEKSKSKYLVNARCVSLHLQELFTILTPMLVELLGTADENRKLVSMVQGMGGRKGRSTFRRLVARNSPAK